MDQRPRHVPEASATTHRTRQGPLAGVRVLDLSRLFAGNMLTQVLADFGAEVIKVEPPAGDTLRAWRDRRRPDATGRSTARNKKSLGLDLRKPEARELLLQLVPSAQMFIESFRPGTLEKMGLAPETLLELNPQLRHRAHLRLGPGRPLPPAPGLRHVDRGHVGLRGDQRLRRPRAGAAADVPGRHDRRDCTAPRP